MQSTSFEIIGENAFQLVKDTLFYYRQNCHISEYANGLIMAHEDYSFMNGNHGMIVFRLDTSKGSNHVLMEMLVGGMYGGLFKWGEIGSSKRRLKHVAGLLKNLAAEKQLQVTQLQTIEVN
ncbi:MAG: hypothetical protein IT252_08275 [Chitinophagaceae bacterium]|nr:hypothetical protein [Chitinophagaceae bacterium]